MEFVLLLACLIFKKKITVFWIKINNKTTKQEKQNSFSKWWTMKEEKIKKVFFSKMIERNEVTLDKCIPSITDKVSSKFGHPAV